MNCQNCKRENPDVAKFCNNCGIALIAVANERPSSNFALGTGFVGRQREITEVISAFEQASSGQGRLVMLVGEPGIGKSRTAREIASIVEQQGSMIFWGRCHEQKGAPPYWPWVQIIRDYVRDRDAEQLRLETGAGAADIAEIVPELGEKIPGLSRSATLDSADADRFRFFSSITTFLKNASHSQPLVLVLEDLHWADKPSLLLLEFLSQELGQSRILVIGTYRDIDLALQHPLSETLGELTRTQRCQRIDLTGLSLEDEGRYIEVASGVEPTREFVEMLHSHTEGNPLFVGEVVRMLQQEGKLTPEHIENLQSRYVRIPEGVREVIGRRLGGLSEGCIQVLTIASVIGRAFEFSQVVSLVEDISEEDLLDVWDEALRARD